MLDFFNAEELTEYVDKKEDTDGRFLSYFLSLANFLYHHYLRLYSKHIEDTKLLLLLSTLDGV